MRINGAEKGVILKAVHSVDGEASVWLFGSRVDDSKRGGDIDIAIRSARIGRLDRMNIRSAIAAELGEQKIDIVVSSDGADPFFRLALQKGVRLDE